MAFLNSGPLENVGWMDRLQTARKEICSARQSHPGYASFMTLTFMKRFGGTTRDPALGLGLDGMKQQPSTLAFSPHPRTLS